MNPESSKDSSKKETKKVRKVRLVDSPPSKSVSDKKEKNFEHIVDKFIDDTITSRNKYLSQIELSLKTALFKVRSQMIVTKDDDDEDDEEEEYEEEGHDKKDYKSDQTLDQMVNDIILNVENYKMFYKEIKHYMEHILQK